MSFFAFCSMSAANIGYCSGESTKSGSFSVEGNADVSGAVYLTPELLAPYDGCEISAIRGALASKVNIDRLTLWIRESLNGENVAETLVTASTDPSLAKGWIETPLESPYVIEASKGLYIGMTYHQKGATKAFSLIGNGFENSFFVRTGDGEWEDRHDEGILSIEAVTSADATPEFDLALLEAVMDYSSDPDFNIVNVRVANNGSRDVTGFTLSSFYSNSPESVGSEHFDVSLASGEKCEVRCMLPKVDDVFVNSANIVLGGIDDGTDAYEGNNAIVARVPSLKKVLVEEFTTERCSNCPRVAQYMHEVCDEDAYSDRIVVVCHHAGYYTDWLTQPCDEEIGWLYGCGSAPAVMYDRTALPGGKMADNPDKKGLRDNFDRQLALAPSVGISMMAEKDDETGELVANVTLKREGNLAMAAPRLSIFLTEDNIKPVLQSGDNDMTHIHQHVIRAYNSTWGEKIEWDGSDYTATIRFVLDPEWKIDDLNVVAFVNNYDPDDKQNNKIDNAESCRIKTASSSVASMGEEEGDVTFLDLSGCRVSAAAKGILVKVTTFRDGTVSVAKVFNK